MVRDGVAGGMVRDAIYRFTPLGRNNECDADMSRDEDPTTD